MAVKIYKTIIYLSAKSSVDITGMKVTYLELLQRKSFKETFGLFYRESGFLYPVWYGFITAGRIDRFSASCDFSCSD